MSDLKIINELVLDPPKQFKCVDCGATFKSIKKRKYCLTCSKPSNALRRYYRKHTKIYYCTICNKQLTRKRKYCQACADKKERDHKLKYYKKYYKTHRGAKEKHCIKCGVDIKFTHKSKYCSNCNPRTKIMKKCIDCNVEISKHKRCTNCQVKYRKEYMRTCQHRYYHANREVCRAKQNKYLRGTRDSHRSRNITNI